MRRDVEEVRSPIRPCRAGGTAPAGQCPEPNCRRSCLSAVEQNTCGRALCVNPVGRASLPPPTSFDACRCRPEAAAFDYRCHSEERSDAPQGGLSCPFGAIHLLGISWYRVPIRTFPQEIATSGYALLAILTGKPITMNGITHCRE